MTLIGFLKKLAAAPRRLFYDAFDRDEVMLLMGRIMVEHVKTKTEPKSIAEVEFKVFSQFGDDGIVQWLINNINVGEKTFIEFGVQDYRESNTRFLMMNNNWSGMVMDGSRKNINRIKSSSYYWKHDLRAKCLFVNKDNVNEALLSSGFGTEVGVLHVDVDGMDYWLWSHIDSVSPKIAIIEYNSLFGPDRLITVPYAEDFNRTAAHYCNLYFGSSLRALCYVSQEKGYAFVGCNSAGNNAYFVRRDCLGGTVKELDPSEGYVESKFRESRDKDGMLSFLDREDMCRIISGLPVYNVETGEIESL